MAHLADPKEKIYLLLFEKPLTVNEISTKIYKRKNINTRVSTYLNELETDGWVKEVKDAWRFVKGSKKDKRNRYYYATSKGLFVSICNELKEKKIVLNDQDNQEIRRLKDFLKSGAITEYIKSYVTSESFLGEKDPLVYIKNGLGLHCLFLDTLEYWGLKRGLTPDLIKEIQKKMKTFDKDKQLRVMINFEWDMLGSSLHNKLGNLLSGYLTDFDIVFYFDWLLKIQNELFRKK